MVIIYFHVICHLINRYFLFLGSKQAQSPQSLLRLVVWVYIEAFTIKHYSDTDLTMFCLCVFTWIVNATFLNHRLNQIKHFLVIGWPKLVLYNRVLCVNLYSYSSISHYFLSKLSDTIKINLFWRLTSSVLLPFSKLMMWEMLKVSENVFGLTSHS